MLTNYVSTGNTRLFIAVLLISKIAAGGQRLYPARPVIFDQQPLLLASMSRSSPLSSTCSG
jgi:hypothetical protein